MKKLLFIILRACKKITSTFCGLFARILRHKRFTIFQYCSPFYSSTTNKNPHKIAHLILLQALISAILLSGCNLSTKPNEIDKSPKLDQLEKNQEKMQKQIDSLNKKIKEKEEELANASKVETFDSSSLGISFEVPSAWIVEERMEGKINPVADGKNIDIKITNCKKTDTACDESLGEVWISTTPNNNELSIPELYGTFNDTSVFWPKKFHFVSFTSKNGLSGIKFPSIDDSSPSSDDPPRTVIDLLDPKNKRMISIHYFPASKNKNKVIEDQYQNLVDSMVIK